MYSCCSTGLCFSSLGGMFPSQIWVSSRFVLQYWLSCFFTRADLINYSFPWTYLKRCPCRPGLFCTLTPRSHCAHFQPSFFFFPPPRFRIINWELYVDQRDEHSRGVWGAACSVLCLCWSRAGILHRRDSATSPEANCAACWVWASALLFVLKQFVAERCLLSHLPHITSWFIF